jgi:hypothetical protein
MIAKFPSPSEYRYIDAAQARRALGVLSSLAREAGQDSTLGLILQLARCEIASLLESEEAADGPAARAA